MATLQLSSSRSPKAFTRVLEAPEIEVADLRSFRCCETEDVAGRDAPSISRALWDGVAKDRFAVSGMYDAGIEFFVP